MKLIDPIIPLKSFGYPALNWLIGNKLLVYVIGGISEQSSKQPPSVK